LIVGQKGRLMETRSGTAIANRPLDPAAEEALVRQWEPLALSIARRLAHRWEGVVDQEDFEQTARIGLLQAARRFDPARNCQFSTFAYPTIVGVLLHYLRDRATAGHIPRQWFELRPRLMQTAEKLAQALGRRPTCLELAEELEVSEEEIAGALGICEFYYPASLDETREDREGEERLSLFGQIRVVDSLLRAAELRVALGRALEELPVRQHEVLRLRYFQGLSQREAGERLGLSQMHVSRLERRALAWLREELCREWRIEPEGAAEACLVTSLLAV
jgi:RNA polymerase sigma-B factor